MMIYRVLADSILLAHFLFILFVLLGGLLVLHWKALIWIHLPAVVWGAGIELVGWSCPLTSLENYLLQESGNAGYSGGFIDHYLLPLIYPAGLTHNVQLVLGIIVLVVNLVVYAIVWHRQQIIRNH